MNQNQFSQIQEKLQKLIKKDKKRSIFGAETHQYELSSPKNEVDLAIFESANQLKLPEDYRTFLTQISDGGAGPFYGLYSLEKGIEEAKYYSTNDDNSIENSFAQDFPISKTEVEKFMQYYQDCLDAGEDDAIEYFEIPERLTGVIFLSEYGCGWSYLVVVKGEMAGSIWFHGDYFCPVFSKGKLWTFFDWYEDWLDSSLAELSPKKAEKTEFDANQTIINYDGWRLKEIPQEVFGCKNLKKLVFSRNDLPEFPKQIIQFTELTILDLSMNPFVEIPPEIGDLKNLKKLELNYNYHLDLPAELAKLSNLEELSMYYNYKIPAIPDVITQLPKLKKLHFSYCSELKKIPESIGNLSNLENLQLNDSGLESLPKSIGKLKKLKYLYIDSTKVTELPDGFEELENLEALGINIPHLDLAKAIEKIKNLPKLTWLRIANQLDFPTNFSELVNIKQLTIEQNYDLWHKGYKNLPIPENLTLIPNLETLNLVNNNQANRLPESMNRLKHLKKLQIGSTSIQVFPESLQFLTQLEQIEAGLNQNTSSPFGVLPEEKEKLIQWFPKAKVLIW